MASYDKMISLITSLKNDLTGRGSYDDRTVSWIVKILGVCINKYEKDPIVIGYLIAIKHAVNNKQKLFEAQHYFLLAYLSGLQIDLEYISKHIPH